MRGWKHLLCRYGYCKTKGLPGQWKAPEAKEIADKKRGKENVKRKVDFSFGGFGQNAWKFLCISLKSIHCIHSPAAKYVKNNSKKSKKSACVPWRFGIILV